MPLGSPQMTFPAGTQFFNSAENAFRASHEERSASFSAYDPLECPTIEGVTTSPSSSTFSGVGVRAAVMDDPTNGEIEQRISLTSTSDVPVEPSKIPAKTTLSTISASSKFRLNAIANSVGQIARAPGSPNNLSHLLEENRKWAARMETEKPGWFKSLAQQQAPEILWIGCSDSRVPANTITNLAPGEVFVHRNIANVFPHTDFNALSVLQYAVDYLKVKHIIVCGHYGCGGVKAAYENKQLGTIDNWLRHIKDIYESHYAEIMSLEDKESRIDFLVELNVAKSVLNVINTPIVQNAWARGQELCVHGWCYTLNDGHIHDLGLHIDSPKTLSPVFVAFEKSVQRKATRKFSGTLAKISVDDHGRVPPPLPPVELDAITALVKRHQNYSADTRGIQESSLDTAIAESKKAFQKACEKLEASDRAQLVHDGDQGARQITKREREEIRDTLRRVDQFLDHQNPPKSNGLPVLVATVFSKEEAEPRECFIDRSNLRRLLRDVAPPGTDFSDDDLELGNACDQEGVGALSEELGYGGAISSAGVSERLPKSRKNRKHLRIPGVNEFYEKFGRQEAIETAKANFKFREEFERSLLPVETAPSPLDSSHCSDINWDPIRECSCILPESHNETTGSLVDHTSVFRFLRSVAKKVTSVGISFIKDHKQPPTTSNYLWHGYFNKPLPLLPEENPSTDTARFCIDKKSMAKDPCVFVSDTNKDVDEPLPLHHRVLVLRPMIAHCVARIAEIASTDSAFNIACSGQLQRNIVETAWRGATLKLFNVGDIILETCGPIPGEEALKSVVFGPAHDLWELVVGFIVDLEKAGVISLADGVEVLCKTFGRSMVKPVKMSYERLLKNLIDLRREPRTNVKLMRKIIQSDTLYVPSILMRTQASVSDRAGIAQLLRSVATSSGDFAWVIGAIEEAVAVEIEQREFALEHSQCFNSTDTSIVTKFLAALACHFGANFVDDACKSVETVVGELHTWDWFTETKSKKLHRQTMDRTRTNPAITVLKSGLEDLLRVLMLAEKMPPPLSYLLCTIRDASSSATAVRFLLSLVIVPHLRDLSQSTNSSIVSASLRDFADVLSLISLEGEVRDEDIRIVAEGYKEEAKRSMAAAGVKAQVRRLIKGMGKHVHRLEGELMVGESCGKKHFRYSENASSNVPCILP
ncbi:hypothetical protein HDU93_004854 [Gonapodya sp. JEL0774]|nr:hypothetical protein HDU93_004854 [Gonapodya sp. JEL0774]